MTRMNIDSKVLLNQKNYILKAKRITAVEIDEIKENIRLKTGDDAEDYTNGVAGDKMDTNVIEHQKRDQESNNTGLIKFREELNGVIEELLEEDEMDITDINNLIYAEPQS